MMNIIAPTIAFCFLILNDIKHVMAFLNKDIYVWILNIGELKKMENTLS